MIMDASLIILAAYDQKKVFITIISKVNGDIYSFRFCLNIFLFPIRH